MWNQTEKSGVLDQGVRDNSLVWLMYKLVSCTPTCASQHWWVVFWHTYRYRRILFYTTIVTHFVILLNLIYTSVVIVCQYGFSPVGNKIILNFMAKVLYNKFFAVYYSLNACAIWMIIVRFSIVNRTLLCVLCISRSPLQVEGNFGGLS